MMILDWLMPRTTLWFGEGESRFGLIVRRPTGRDRLAIIDALRTSLVDVDVAATRMVVGWEEVCDLAGRAIPFKCRVQDGARTNLGVFLGQASFNVQISVLTELIRWSNLPPEIVTQIMDTIRPVVTETGHNQRGN